MLEQLNRYLKETEEILHQWGLKFPEVNVYYSWIPYSYFSSSDNAIVISRSHLRSGRAISIQTILHEAFHCYLDKYQKIHKSHSFRVKQNWLPYSLKTIFHRFLYEDYSEIDPDEGRCELFAEMIYYGDLDLRLIFDEKKRKQIKAMRLMIREIEKEQYKEF